MTNRITNTPIGMNIYNSRSITTNHSVTKNCVRQADGTLWAVVGYHSAMLQLLRSTDNGFSWDVADATVEITNDLREVADLNADGLFAYIVIDERWRILDIYMGSYENIGGDFFIDRARYDLDNISSTPTTGTILTTTDNPGHGMFDICHSHENIFITWTKTSDTKLYVTRCSPRSTAVSSDLALSSPTGLYGHLSSCCDKNGKVYIAYGYLDGSDRKLEFVEYDSTTPSFGTPVLIENLGASPCIAKDIAIAIDGYGTLCVVYFDQGDEVVRYATSIDSGATWDVNSLTRTGGYDVFTDSITSDKAGRTNIIGSSSGGFILTYCEKTSTQNGRCFVRQLTTSDSGATYDLGDEKEVATNEPWNDQAVVGVQFFHPTDVKLLDLAEPGHCRIAFTVGEGDSETMADTLPISVGQELLFESAYSTSLSTETGSHSIDTADSNSILVSFDLHAGPDENIDFYAGGFTGTFTDRYLAAFERIGTNFRLLKYEPDADNFLDDKSAYGSPTEYNTLALLDPVTYSFPSPTALDVDDTVAYIEQDIRKLHLPPDFHLSRTFLVNKGGYLKRTVWLVEFDNNQYELSQVIPRFIKNQICFYEVNAYIVGPSRDPFSRTVLPSET